MGNEKTFKIPKKKKGRMYMHLNGVNYVKIAIDLDVSELQIAWQMGKLQVWWNAEEISNYVEDIRFVCDTDGHNKIAELTVLEALLTPRNYKLID